MSFVPSLCLGCWRVHLASLSAAQSGKVACKSCGGEARIAPGCSFPPAEEEAFEELSAIVAEGSLSSTEARGYAAQVEQALASGSYGARLEILSARLPGLLPHQAAAGKSAAAQRRILVKLKTILEAMGTASRRSTEYSEAGASGPARAQLR